MNKASFLSAYILLTLLFATQYVALAVPFVWINGITIGRGDHVKPLGNNGKMILSMVLIAISGYAIISALNRQS